MLTFTRKQLGSYMLLITLLLTSSPLWAGSLAPFDPTTAPAQPNSAERSAWLAFPDNPDQYGVDVFWVYPTILADNEHWLMDMTSQPLQQLAQETIIRQASVFTGQANLYAPYYRQMNMADGRSALDYSFFYENLRANLAQRIQAFMTRTQH